MQQCLEADWPPELLGHELGGGWVAVGAVLLCTAVSLGCRGASYAVPPLSKWLTSFGGQS